MLGLRPGAGQGGAGADALQRRRADRTPQQVHGDAPIYERLHEARERAEAAGATNIEVRPIIGGPVHVLLDLAEEVQADLLVVGNLGMTTTGGRLLGSVPASVTHHAKTDVLVVHTRD